MVELIGLTTIVALTWLLASTMATESDAERRRESSAAGTAVSGDEGATVSKTRHAA